MKVQDLMTRSVTTCLLQDSLQDAAQKLWERDCGCLPVVDGDRRPLAMLTDRDVCMAAWTTGRALQDLQVAQAMSKQLVTCRAQEDLNAAAGRMAKHGVRRLPVLDATGVLVGVVSLNDIALAAAKEPTIRTTGATGDALRVLLAVSAHRTSGADTAAQVAAPSKPTMTLPAAVATPLPVPAAARLTSPPAIGGAASAGLSV